MDRDQLTAVLVDLSGGVVAGRTAPLDLGAGPEALLDAVESAVYGLIGAGLPVLGGGTRGGPPADGAEGGELWQQASEGEVWTGRRRAPGPRPGTGAGSVPVVGRTGAEADADSRRAVAEEGELWRDEGPVADTEGPTPEAEAEAEPDAEPEPEPGVEPEAEAGADAEPQPGPAEAEFGAGHPPPATDPVGPGARWGSVVGVGVAAPGPLDHVRGVLGQVTGHPEWAGFPLRDALARRLGMPVVLDKDTNAAALGLALRGKESLAYVHLGTGLGAGLVLDGRIHRGRRNGAGEFGHQVIELDGPPCRCGRNGCLEALCGDAVRRGRPEEAARVLGVGAANLVSLLDVDRVLLGGRTVLADPDVYVDGVAAQLRAAAGASGGAAHRPGPGKSEARSGSGARSGTEARRGSARDAVPGGVRVEIVPEGSRTVADGAAQLVLAPLFGRAPGTPAASG
ncbi:ROK family protein [Streptomyces sp. Amel2xB2]|uniref:ROK family protein n=1 Tax=Streptomyces sp. Amel2xB2 TaxID=1305829 RepID=UPI0035CD1C1F